MKRIYILILAAFAFTMTACNDWLDISPSDIVDEEELFEEGTGYRNALNGVYSQMSSKAMFGRELTWGMADVMAQMYANYKFINHSYTGFSKYEYTSDNTKAVIQSLWHTAYNAIANCNNIIARIESEPASKFKGGEMEKELIWGEALAIRGFLHFEMLCYFAPALVKEHAGNWIPYSEKFSEKPTDYVSVEGCLERCVRDLTRAQELITPFDTYQTPTLNHLVWLLHDYRFFAKPKLTYPAATDIFYAFRGYRMNLMATTAILARIYSYAGKYDLAAAEAQKVIDFKAISGSTNAFDFTALTEVEGNYKMSKDLIFALSDVNIIDDYKTFTSSSNSFALQLPYGYDLDYFDAASDYRLTTLIKKAGTTFFPQRFTKPNVTGEYTAEISDMLPVIRVSEMYYIKGEYLASIGDFTGATDQLEAVRQGRNCPAGMLTGKITNMDGYVKEMLRETRREFMEEGLVFYYHKKCGKSLLAYGNMKDAAYYFPLPETETVN